MRKVFLDDLPRKNGKSKRIDWVSVKDTYVRVIYDDKEYVIAIENYDKQTGKLKCKFKNNELYISTNHFKEGKLGILLGKINKEYLYNIGDVINSMEIINQGHIVNKNFNIRAYQIKCLNCRFDSGEHYKNGKLVEEYWVSEYHLKEGQGCPCCANKIIVQGINDMYTTDHWMVELGVNEEFAKTHTKSCATKAPCRCPHCGSINHKACDKIYRDKSISCVCGDGFSYPEKFMCNMLKQLNVEFKMQYSPDYLIPSEGKKYRKYSDFYIPSSKLVIETDGRLGHEGGISYARTDAKLEEHIEIDNWKDEQHLNHGIKTIRINCFESNMEYIKENILKSELVNYFDFSGVDWDSCEKYALNNLVKEVSNYWNTKEECETTKDLAKKFNINRGTVIKYLKIGYKLKWTCYNVNVEKSINSVNNGKMRGIPIEIFKHNISLGVFESASELSRKSEEMFGVRLTQNGILRVVRGYRNHHKGYTFRYVDQPTNQEESQVF